MKNTQPLINIVTRASRKDAVIDCIKSVNEQTYKNFHHIITYESEDFKQHLQNYTNQKKTTLCAVQKTKPINNLRLKFWYKDGIDINDVDFELTEDREDSWYAAPDGTYVVFGHFHPNLYNLKAERYIKDGWIIYLDDECTFYNEQSLEVLVDGIIKYDNNYLHWLYANNKPDLIIDDYIGEHIYQKESMNAIVPIVGFMNHIVNGGFPPLGTLGGACYCFHSDYLQYTQWSCWRGDDWQTAVSLQKNIPNANLIIKQPIINVFNSD